MKKVIALAILSNVAHAESDTLSWFSTPEMTFENKSEQSKQEKNIQPLPTPADFFEQKKSQHQRVIRSLERIEATKTPSLPPELKKCRNVFRATISPSSEDSQGARLAMGLSEHNWQNFKPESFTVIFSTDPNCFQENNRSPQFSSLLNELRQRAKATHLSGGTP